MKYKSKVIYTLIGLCLFWFLFLKLSGAFQSGFHFTDDHAIYQISDDLKADGYWPTMKKWISNDLEIRFRFFYYITYITKIYLWGDTFNNYYYYDLLHAMLAASLLFLLGLKTFKGNRLLSLLFSFMSMMGMQVALWYRLGLGETEGLTCILAACYIYTWDAKSMFSKILKYKLYFIFIISGAMFKETFLIAIPAFTVWMLYMKNQHLNWEIIKNNKLFCSVNILLVLIGLCCIKFLVGNQTIGYAGYDGFSFKYIINIVKSAVWLFLLTNGFAISLGLMLLFWVKNQSNTKLKILFKKFFSDFGFIIIFNILLLGPQFVIYMKSTMTERYLIPSTLGPALAVCFGLMYLLEHGQKYYKYAIIVSIFLATSQVGVAFYRTYLYACEGIKSNQMLDYIKENSDKNTPILIAAEPTIYYNEWLYSMKTYFKSSNNNRQNITQLLLLSKPEDQYESYDKELIKYAREKFGIRTIEKLDSVPYKFIIAPDKNRLLLLSKSSSGIFKTHKRLLEYSDSYLVWEWDTAEVKNTEEKE